MPSVRAQAPARETSSASSFFLLELGNSGHMPAESQRSCQILLLADVLRLSAIALAPAYLDYVRKLRYPDFPIFGGGVLPRFAPCPIGLR